MARTSAAAGGPPRHRDLLGGLDDDAAGHQCFPAGDARGLPSLGRGGADDVQPPREFSLDQQLADFAVVQLRVHLGQHADPHPVLCLRIDGPAEGVARHAQVLVHQV
jgi:hypothetical protein